MTLADFAALVARMRAAQRAYFRSRNALELIAAKRLEREVDDAVREILGPMVMHP